MLHPRGEVDNKLAGAQWDYNEGNPAFYFQKLRRYDYTWTMVMYLLHFSYDF